MELFDIQYRPIHLQKVNLLIQHSTYVYMHS